MTFQDVKQRLRQVGVTISRTNHREFRVNIKGHLESEAYYTKDLDDAYNTGIAMHHKAHPGANNFHPVAN